MRPLHERTVRILAAGFVIYSIVLTSVAVAFQFFPSGATLSIQHTPVEQITAGTSVEIKAVVKGGAADYNVTLRYKIRSSSQWKIGQMLPTVRGGNTYLHEILGAEVTEPVDYQICAKDRSNARLCTQTYTILVGDFYFVAYLTPLFYPNRTSSMDIEIQSVNGFDQPVELSISGLPAKVLATFEPSRVTITPSQKSTAKLHFRIRDSAPAGKYDLTVAGTSGSITRSFVMTLSIPDFELVVTPSSYTMKHDARTSFTITLRSLYGFDSNLTIGVNGLPKGTSLQLAQSELHLNGVAILVLSIETAASVEKGIYEVVVSVLGGGRLNTFTIILVVL